MQTPPRSDGFHSPTGMGDRQAASPRPASSGQDRTAVPPGNAPKPGGNRALIGPMLKAGYGVEDIAVKTGLPVREIRFSVALLRESGSLGVILRGKPGRKGRAARIE